MKLEVGKVYDVDHTRKGKFKARVDNAVGDWVSVTVTEGAAYGMTGGWIVGDELVVAKGMAKFDGEYAE